MKARFAQVANTNTSPEIQTLSLGPTQDRRIAADMFSLRQDH